MKENMYVVFSGRAGNHLMPLCEVLVTSSSVIHIVLVAHKQEEVCLFTKKSVGFAHNGFETVLRAQHIKSSVDEVSKKVITTTSVDPNQTFIRKES